MFLRITHMSLRALQDCRKEGRAFSSYTPRKLRPVLMLSHNYRTVMQ